MKTHFLLLAAGMLFFISCVDEYKLPPDITANYSQEIVIEGRILSGGTSVFYVSRTLALTDNQTCDPVTDARITIIGQNGYESKEAEYVEEAQYIIESGPLNPNTLYAVRVEADGETYQSEFQSIMETPEIEEVSYLERDGAISLHVSTSNSDDASRYYMWTFEEDWEFHAEVDFVRLTGSVPLYNKETYPLDNPEENPYYYCWGHQNSHSLYIYSTETLAENRVKEHELFRISMEDIRISYIYSLLVKQWVITEDAYEYYRLMKLYTEESDGLFTPMPSDVRGNLTCISNSDKGVRGIITASDMKDKRLFVYAADFKKNTPTYENCSWEFAGQTAGWQYSWLMQMMYNAAVIMTTKGELDDASILYRANCVDCRNTTGASKQRPTFWPNNHQ